MDAERIRSRLQTMKTYENASEFFGDLGYTYANDAPVPTRNWPESVLRHEVRPQYIAQHGDFKVIYCEMTGARMLRTVQRSIIDQLAREHAFFMMVFHQKIGNAWDFVNVSVTKDSDEKRVRRIARRIGITEAERVRNRLFTAADRLAQIDISRQQNITALQVQSLHNKAFDVEQVTKDFYNQYVRVFTALSDDIALRNPAIQQDAAVEALRLLDRLMFLYFIQKKGWLNQQYDYLYTHFQDYVALLDTTSYYTKVIVPLFYALANREVRLDDVGDVPFLNGGLFQFDQNSSVYHLQISNRVFQQAFDNLFERYNFTVEEDMPDDRAVAIDPEMLGKVFESLILNIEQEKDLRKVTGSYYTPRTIVSFMCQQSLREYIVQRWRDNFHPQSPDGELPLKMESKAGQQELRSVVLDQQESNYQKRIVAFVEDGIPTDLSHEEAQQVRHWLLDVRVIDPAVGSGAFLVGMLQEIIRLVTLLDEHTGDHDILHPNYAYSLKREIIGRCLYGVDIQEQAVQICELRLWLSLVVDYEPEYDNRSFGQRIRDIEPLPNLSYLVRQGNSLIERVLGKTIKLDTTTYAFNRSSQLIDEIQTLKTTYFRSTDPMVKHHIDRDILTKQAELTAQLLRLMTDKKRAEFNKKHATAFPGMEKSLSRAEQREKEASEAELDELHNLISQAEDIRKRAEKLSPDEGIIKQLRNQLGAFIWRVDFGEVFAERDGFDIAIANPPYIRQEKIKEYKSDFQKLFPEVYTGTADLYIYFYAQALRLLRTNGVLAFISPNKFLLANYGRELRQHLSKTTTLELLMDFGDLPVFDATTYPFITITRLRAPEKNAETRILRINEMATIELLTDTARNSDTMLQSELKSSGWQLVDKKTQKINQRIDSKSISLKEYVNGEAYYGIKPGVTEAYVISDEKRRELIERDPNSANLIRPFARGRDIERWRIRPSSSFIILAKIGIQVEDYPAIYDHLLHYRARLEMRDDFKPLNMKWYHLRPLDYYDVFEKPKILYQRFQVRPAFVLDKEMYYTNDAVWILGLEDYFLVGYLNSLLGWYEISRHCTPIQNGYQLIWDYFKNVRVPIIEREQQAKVAQIERVAHQLAELGKSPQQIQQLEVELNQLVFDIYGFKSEEIAFIYQKMGTQPYEYDVGIETIRESYDEGWLVVEVTAFDDKTRLPERGVVRYQTPEDDEAYRKADELKQEELEAKTFYVFYNEKES